MFIVTEKNIQEKLNIKIKVMKKRTLNELRQTKDSYYRVPRTKPKFEIPK